MTNKMELADMFKALKKNNFNKEKNVIIEKIKQNSRVISKISKTKYSLDVFNTLETSGKKD